MYQGFDEGQPGTYLSLGLLCTICLVTYTAARNESLTQRMRGLAWGACTVTVLSVLDEIYEWHESFGMFVRKTVTFLPKRLTLYTDDVLIALATLIASVLLYHGLRRISQERDLHVHYIIVLGLALCHALLDVLGHGSYALEAFLPGLAPAAIDSLDHQIGCFEEWCKIWCEWFVLLLFVRVFFGQVISLMWSLLLFIGSVVATVALWAVADVQAGVPYLTIGRPLYMLRNFPALLSLSWVWFAWAGIAWCCFRQNEDKLKIAGLLYTCPLSLFFAAEVDAESVGLWLRLCAETLLPNAYYAAASARHGLLVILFVVPGLFVGLSVGQGLKHYPWLVGCGLCVLGIAYLMCFPQTHTFTFEPLRLIQAGGLVVPLIGLFLLFQQRRLAGLVWLAFVGACFLSQPIWLVMAVTVSVISWAYVAPKIHNWWGRQGWAVVLLLSLVTSVLLFRLSVPAPLPHHDYLDRAKTFFLTKYQPYEKYRIVIRQVRTEEAL